MPQNYVPIFIFAFVAFLVGAGTLAIASLVRPRNPSKIKLMPYECGITPFDNARGRYTVRYYIVAILFVVFDVETIFLFPWAVQFKLLGVVWPAGDGNLPRNPHRGLHMDLEEGRSGVGVGFGWCGASVRRKLIECHPKRSEGRAFCAPRDFFPCEN